MIARSLTALAWALTFFQYGVAAAPTWPSPVDELEDIMFLNTGYRARGFAVPITPCTSAGTEGFISAAQWLRMAFHDMGTANIGSGVGGLDASIVFELGYGSNNSPGFSITLLQLAPFFSARASMSDLIALSVYTSVRGCGGPVVPIRAGRIDATAQGPNPDTFLPQPGNSLLTFQSQFSRLGFNTPQMIAVVACGHTLGQVHAITFPQIATAGTKNLDSTPTVFDQHVASDYLAGTTPDLLVNGPRGTVSDKLIFGGDGNVTIQSMATAAGFNNMCSTVLQQMIEVVPSGVTLTAPIVPYDVKPSALQLTLLGGGASFSFSGLIRVRTTNIAASQITAVQLVFVDRNGGNQCGSGGCTITSSYAGTSAGFDDGFVFYGFSSQIPTSTSISSFNVIITFTGGATAVYNNNGVGFPVQDTIMLQTPQSCLSPVSGGQNLTIVAAVRNTIASPAVTLTLTKKVSVSGLNVPSLQTTSFAMTSQSTIGPYTLFAASSVFNIYQLASTNVKFDVSVGTGANQFVDSFKNSNGLPGTCATLSPNIASTTTTATSASTSSATMASASASASAPPGWSAVGCYADNVEGGRTLRSGQAVPGGAAAMTVELCVAACQAAGFSLAGLEYSQECWCDNSLNNGGGPAPDSNAGCNMPCRGNTLEMCGGSNRLNVYIAVGGGSSSSSTTLATTTPSTTATATSSASTSTTPSTSLSSSSGSASTSTTPSTTISSSTATSTSATASAPAGWTALGCYSDNVAGGRTLRNGEAVLGGPTAMTIELCVAVCQAAGFSLAGVEYSQECWCDNSLNNGGGPASDGCNMPCKGNALEMCGGPNRLNLYSLGSSSSSSSNILATTTVAATGSTSTSATTSATASTTASAPAGWIALGCYSDNVAGGRTLRSGEAVLGGPTAMTVELCVVACQAAGFQLAGVEYSQECWCDISLNNGGGPASDGCNMPCKGNALEMCGGPNRLNLYSLGSSSTGSTTAATTSTISATTPSSMTTPSTTSLLATASTTATSITNPSTSTTATISTKVSSSASTSASAVSGWTALGCYSDNVNGGRTLRNGQNVPGAMTVELCIAACQSGGFLYAGVEYAGQCYCDNSLNFGGGPASDGNLGCNMPCNGNAFETCGGPNRLNVYQNPAYKPVGNPTISGYSYLGCYNELPNGRALSYTSTASDSMTVESCAAFCNGANYFGVEYGRECYCGPLLPSASTLQSAALCSFVCAGNSLEYCGAGNLLNIYESNNPVDIDN